LNSVLLVQVAAVEGHLHSTEAREALGKGQDELLQWVKEQMFTPAYTRYVWPLYPPLTVSASLTDQSLIGRANCNC
jgi:hypothetical protein